jgi:transposase
VLLLASGPSRLRSGGPRRLHSRKSSGCPAQLQKPPLLRLLKRGALAAGFPTDRWTLRRIQQVIKREFDVSYHPDYLLSNFGQTE